MIAPNVFEDCPIYETASFRLRKVRLADAESLLSCYSDKTAVSKMNADNCTRNLYCTTIEEMENCIRFWLDEYRQHRYIRFSIIPKAAGRAVGTIGIFGGESEVLTVDIATEYDKEEYFEEFIRLSVLRFIRDFQVGSLKIKVKNTPERLPLLKKYGFVPSVQFCPQAGYYERPAAKAFDESKGVAFCGLACCVCSENKHCGGCMAGCQRDRNACKHWVCCNAKRIAGCWECGNFACGAPMFASTRIRAFSRFIAENGSERLTRALRNNEANGVLYHYTGQHVGDYDLFQTEEEIIQLIESGL